MKISPPYSNHSAMKNVIFIGFPKSGKTVIGKEVSKELDLPWFDLDHIMVEYYHTRYGTALSCKEIWETRGEIFFRNLESECFKDFIHDKRELKSPFALSLGGGAPLNESILQFLKACHSHTEVIYLKVSPDIIHERMVQTRFPKFIDTDNSLESLHFHYSKRDVIYSSAASLVLEIHESHVGHTISYVYEKIKNRLQGTRKEIP